MWLEIGASIGWGLNCGCQQGTSVSSTRALLCVACSSSQRGGWTQSPTCMKVGASLLPHDSCHRPAQIQGEERWSLLCHGRSDKKFVVVFNDFIYLLLERGEGGRERKRNRSVASRTPPAGDLAHNPAVFSDQESNCQSCALWDDAQPVRVIVICNQPQPSL